MELVLGMDAMVLRKDFLSNQAQQPPPPLKESALVTAPAWASASA
jgi:hypothetical protein